MNTQNVIVELLLSTKREGIEGTGKLLDYLVKGGFFEAPASTRFHNCYVGGLADHSLAVYNRLREFSTKIDFNKNASWGAKPMNVEPENLIIAAILHDVCKVGAYVRTKADDGWTNNRDKDKGHAALSIARIKKYIVLMKLEEMMIRYHMGVYGCDEYDPKSGEYPLTSGEHEDTRQMSKEQKIASQKRRYGKSLRNAWYHNPIVKWMSFADEQATAESR